MDVRELVGCGNGGGGGDMDMFRRREEVQSL